MSRIIIIEVEGTREEDQIRMALEVSKIHGYEVPKILTWTSIITHEASARPSKPRN